MQSPLTAISQKLFTNAITLNQLKETLTAYKSLLLTASTVEMDANEHQMDIHLENGFAIGLKWAASCLDDAIRTHKLMLGTKQAIEEKWHESKSTVHLLYAGTGPFATLVLPLLAYFSADQLHVTLLEINRESVKNVAALVEYFKFESQIVEIRCADATKTIFEDAEKFDILLSETMQHALQGEQQVIICSHLLNQMSERAILLPVSIHLDLVKITSFGTPQETTQRIGEIMKVDAAFLRAHASMNRDWVYEVNLDVIEVNGTDFLAISTMIDVFKTEKISWGESGLTVPKILCKRDDLAKSNSISLRYVLNPTPGFEIVTK